MSSYRNYLFSLAVMLFTVPLLTACTQQPQPQSWDIVYEQEGLSFRGISAVNDQVCWVSGSSGTILRTIDGGASWQQLSIPGTDSLDFRDIEAFDAQTAIAMSIGSGSSSRIYKTTDGGNSWIKVHQNEYEEGFYDAIAFWDNQHGILQGDPVEGRLYVLVTSDGGDSWQEIPIADMPDGKEGEYGFAASGTHLVVHGTSTAWLGTGGSVARVFKSNDKGANWRAYDTPVISGESSQGIFSLAFKDATHGVAVGGDYTKEKEGSQNIAVTEDGGRNWELVDNTGVDYRSGVRYADGYYIAVGPSGSNYSSDDGQSWKIIEGPGFHAASVGAEGLESVWASGADGRIGKLVRE
ncbi:MAG: oxidoreductase [Balneolaceae bacterium]|nr:oxidoreductase [Balneolaceae bacterium]